MINKIISGISKAINEQFGDDYEIYEEEIEQNLKEPCFSIVCIKPTNELFRQTRYFRKNQFCIHYFPSSKNKRTECQEVLEKLYSALEYIEIEETFEGNTTTNKTMGTNMNGEIDEGVLHFFVNYDMYVDKIEEKETSMDSCGYNTEMKEG